MRDSFVASTLVVAAIVGAPAASAQGRDRVPELDRMPYVARALAPGARVRATVASSPDRPTGSARQVTGRLVRLGADSLLVEHGNVIVAVPRHGLVRLEMPGGSVSRGRSALQGAKVGGTIGVVGGALLSYLAYDSCEGEPVCLSREDEAILGGIVAGALGLAVGGVVGAVRGGERWRPVTVDAETRVGVRAGAGTLSLSLRL